MSYRNLKKKFNISDAEYHRLPERRKKFYTRNETPLLETARVYPITPRAAARVNEESRSRNNNDLLDNVVTGLAIGSGIAIANNILDSLLSDNETSPMDSSVFSDNSTEFGGGDFGGAGAGGEW